MDKLKHGMEWSGGESKISVCGKHNVLSSARITICVSILVSSVSPTFVILVFSRFMMGTDD